MPGYNKRCTQLVKDRRKWRRCKKLADEYGRCKVHAIQTNHCCFCGEMCSLYSQSCGKCARAVSMQAIGGYLG